MYMRVEWKEAGERGGGPGKGKIKSEDLEGRSDESVAIDFLNLHHEQNILGIDKTYCL